MTFPTPRTRQSFTAFIIKYKVCWKTLTWKINPLFIYLLSLHCDDDCIFLDYDKQRTSCDIEMASDVRVTHSHLIIEVYVLLRFIYIYGQQL